MENTARNNILSELHISYSQIFTYLACSLKYQFRYVFCMPAEKIGLALPFGSAIHKALERYYRAYFQGHIESLSVLQDLFAEVLMQQLSENKGLVMYNKTIPDADCAITMGKEMIRVFHENTDLAGWTVKGIELPLSAPLYTDTGQVTDFKLVGFIDLLLEDPGGELVVVDHKTAARSKNQAGVDSDMQMTAYSYLLATNRYVFPTAPVKGRFDVLRKLKTPKLEYYQTQRTATDRKRLAKIACGVLSGIDAKVFIPSKGWMCGDCEYARACTDWHR